MTTPFEDRLARLEESVQLLEEAAAREQARRASGRWARLALLLALAAFYAWYLHSVSGPLAGR